MTISISDAQICQCVRCSCRTHWFVCLKSDADANSEFVDVEIPTRQESRKCVVREDAAEPIAGRGDEGTTLQDNAGAKARDAIRCVHESQRGVHNGVGSRRSNAPESTAQPRHP